MTRSRLARSLWPHRGREEHAARHGPLERAGDRVSGVFVPIVDAVRAVLPLPDGFTADDSATEPTLPKPQASVRLAAPAGAPARRGGRRPVRRGGRPAARPLHRRREGRAPGPAQRPGRVGGARRDRARRRRRDRRPPARRAVVGPVHRERRPRRRANRGRARPRRSTSSSERRRHERRVGPLPLAPSAGPLRPRRSRLQVRRWPPRGQRPEAEAVRAYAAANPSVGIVEEPTPRAPSQAHCRRRSRRERPRDHPRRVGPGAGARPAERSAATRSSAAANAS